MLSEQQVVELFSDTELTFDCLYKGQACFVAKLEDGSTVNAAFKLNPKFQLVNNHKLKLGNKLSETWDFILIKHLDKVVF